MKGLQVFLVIGVPNGRFERRDHGEGGLPLPDSAHKLDAGIDVEDVPFRDADDGESFTSSRDGAPEVGVLRRLFHAPSIALTIQT